VARAQHYLAPWESVPQEGLAPATSATAAASSAELAQSAQQAATAGSDQATAEEDEPATTKWLLPIPLGVLAPAARWIALGVATVLVAVSVFFVGRYLLVRSAKPAPEQAGDARGTVIPTSRRKAERQWLLEGHWTDATRASLKLGVYEVRVLGAELGPVLGRDNANRVVTVADLALTIRLEIRNRSTEPTDYQSWYATAVRNEGAGVDLVDNTLTQYPLLAFGEGQAIRGHTPQANLERGQRTTDVLIFHIPAEVDRKKVQEFYLWLDNASQGGEGELRFKIPVSMVSNW
jgi:hypothetical protein